MPTSTESTFNRSSIGSSSDPVQDELSQLKRQLLQVEVRLAKARATAAGAEADVKVLSARLRALIK